MDRLARTSGLHSLAGAQAVYASAVPMAVDGLIGMVSTASGAGVLLRRAQELRTSDPRRLTDYFNLGEHSVDEDLAQEVFGSGLTAAIRTLAMQHGIDPESARCVLEASTGVSLAMAVRLVRGSLTIEGLTGPILAEQERFHGSSSSRPAAADAVEMTSAASADDSVPVGRPVATEINGRRDWRLGLTPLGGVAWAAAVFLAVVGLGLATVWLSQRGEVPEALPFIDEPMETEEAPDERPPDQSTDLVVPAREAVLDVASPPEPIGAPDNYAVMSGGRIFLRGFVPSSDVESLIVAAVGEVLGPDQVVSEYVVDPEVPFVEGREVQVYVEETVLFETASAEIAPDFLPLLGVGLNLLELQDGVVLEVIGHTDSVGDEAYNLRLSQERVDAVRAFFVAQGIDPDRVVAEGRGEGDPRASNDTADGRQANRRVEFLITGFRFSG